MAAKQMPLVELVDGPGIELGATLACRALSQRSQHTAQMITASLAGGRFRLGRDLRRTVS
jgi:hypothetical protein